MAHKKTDCRFEMCWQGLAEKDGTVGESRFESAETQQGRHSEHYSDKPCTVAHYCAIERYLKKIESL